MNASLTFSKPLNRPFPKPSSLQLFHCLPPRTLHVPKTTSFFSPIHRVLHLDYSQEWVVLDWIVNAINFYEEDEWRICWLTAPALQAYEEANKVQHKNGIGLASLKMSTRRFTSVFLLWTWFSTVELY